MSSAKFKLSSVLLIGHGLKGMKTKKAKHRT
jgi:hypothetical protein